VKRISLSQQAYDCIKQKIVSLALPPGEVIDEASLRKELGLGRTPIREALQRLALEKLVVIVPRRGMFVTEIGITDLQQLFEVRLVLECLATRLAAQRGTAVHWQPMETTLARLAKDEDADNETFIEIDAACHQLIYEAAENEFLKDTLVTMYALSLRLWYYFLARIGNMRGAILEHKHMLEALRAGDANEASQLMERHIQAFQEEIQAVMIGTPTP
jgi:DNA-binding GntR family transcriptional regulator